MKLLTWNVQGLGGPLHRRYRGRLRQALKPCLRDGPLDIMMVQEHHLNEKRIKSYGSFLPGNWEMIWSSAIGNSGTQGGVCMAIADKWKTFIISQEVIVPGRAQYVVIHERQTTWGYLNIYAPNHASARKQFWCDIAAAVPQVDHWCMAGDFNMIEDPMDRKGGSSVTIFGEELAAWERLCLKLRILDVWFMPNVYRYNGSLQFSRSDRRIGGANLSRLDRFYVDDVVVPHGGSVNIMPGITFSDHAPVILVTFKRADETVARLKIPERILLDDKYDRQVREIWCNKDINDAPISHRVAQAVIELSTFFKERSNAEYVEYCAKEANYRAAYTSLQRLQQNRPESSWVAERLQEARSKIQHMDEVRSQFYYHNVASKWTQHGDRCTSHFFCSKRPKKASNIVLCLRNEQGELETHPDGLREIATRFYVDLLSEEPMSADVRYHREKVWQEIQPQITHSMTEELVLPLTMLELETALQSLADNKCPGMDGLTTRFYKKYWDLFKADLILAFQYIFDYGEMPDTMSEGLIYLIPKADGISEDIRKWRPITILNTCYKLFAKVLGLRLQKILPEIIHASQTGFMQERSIMDNIYMFWEATAVAVKTEQKLAILLLDFEKAYDRVDWNFLEGIMYRLGFTEYWIRGVSCLYKNAYSQVLVARGIGRRFKITRSVRQGCPLAPFLFLLFAEAMTMFIRSQSSGVRRLALPQTGQEILDAEFADDTTLYVEGTLDNLQRVQHALQHFCIASGARLNWNKTVAFWVSSEPPPSWLPHPLFQWTERGEARRYLGVQVGINLAPEAHVAPLLLTLRKKLFLWSQAKLSLAGRVVVANHVLLATMWYIASSWMFSKSCIGQIRRLVRNFLWAGQDRDHVRAKVAWSTIITPKNQGGLGIIDPVDQTMALLAKLLIRGLLPGHAVWKQMLAQRLYRCSPHTGGSWKDSLRWIFVPDTKYVTSRAWEDKFFNSLLRAWAHIKTGLHQVLPTCEEEYLQQHLVWNPIVHLSSGHMLGARPRLDWAKLDENFGASVDTWRLFDALTLQEKSRILATLRGGRTMYAQVQEAVHNLPSGGWPVQAYRWEGAFTRLQVLVGVRGYCTNGNCLIYDVDGEGNMSRSGTEIEIMHYSTGAKVRVLAYDGFKWIIDPRPELIKLHWKLRVFEKTPLIRLQWDPGAFYWKDPYGCCEKRLGFFEYSVKLGRHIVSAQRMTRPSAERWWFQQGMSSDFLAKFWATLWSSKKEPKIIIMQWLLIHRALPVGQMQHSSESSRCKLCNYPIETLKHCLWECQAAQLVWKRVLRILAIRCIEGLFSWGMVVWATSDVMTFQYDSDPRDTVFKIQQKRVSCMQMEQLQVPYVIKNMHIVWELMCTITMWYIWTARCSKVFDDNTVHPVETVRNIWVMAVHTLKGQYDDLISHEPNDKNATLSFLAHWQNGPFLQLRGGSPIWNFTPPTWLFPPPIT